MTLIMPLSYYQELNRRANDEYSLEDGVAEMAARDAFGAFIFLGRVVIEESLKGAQIERTTTSGASGRRHSVEIFVRDTSGEVDYDQPLLASTSWERGNGIVPMLPVQVHVRVYERSTTPGARAPEPNEALSFLVDRVDTA